MQGTCHLLEFGDELAVISHKSQETSDLCDVHGYGPFLDSLDLTFISGYSLGRNHVPQIGKLLPE